MEALEGIRKELAKISRKSICPPTPSWFGKTASPSSVASCPPPGIRPGLGLSGLWAGGGKHRSFRFVLDQTADADVHGRSFLAVHYAHSTSWPSTAHRPVFLTNVTSLRQYQLAQRSRVLPPINSRPRGARLRSVPAQQNLVQGTGVSCDSGSSPNVTAPLHSFAVFGGRGKDFGANPMRDQQSHLTDQVVVPAVKLRPAGAAVHPIPARPNGYITRESVRS